MVELLDQPGAQLGEQLPGVETGCGGGHDRRELLQHPQVGDERLAGARVLHLHGDRRAVGPGGAVHLPDAGRRDRPVVEVLEHLPPARAEGSDELLVHHRRRHGRRRLLQPDERVAVRADQLLGERGLHRRHRLADLHRAALELAEGGEQLLGGALLHLRGDHLRGAAADPPPEADGGAAGVRGRQRGQPGHPGEAAPGRPAVLGLVHRRMSATG